MGVSRTILALVVLLVGMMTLLVLRYDPWLIAAIIDNPLITIPLVAVVAAFVGIGTLHRVPDPKRAVVFYEERFDRIDPRGRLPLLPGVERIGAEISLDEQRVLGWPILLYDKEGKEQLVAFGLTWRLVPRSARPQNDRERRILLMSNAERQRIVLQVLEGILRDIARSLSLDELKAALSDPEAIESILERLNNALDRDTLTVDRLHMLRVAPAEKKDEPKPARETHSLTQTRDWKGEVQGGGPSLWRGLLPATPGGQLPAPQAAPAPAAGGVPPSAGVGAAPESAPNVAVVHEEIKRVEEIVRGAKENGADKGNPKTAGLTTEDHTAILKAIIEHFPDVIKTLRTNGKTVPYTGQEMLSAANAALPLGEPVQSRIAAALRTLDVLATAYGSSPVWLIRTVDAIIMQLSQTDPPATARALKAKGEEYKKAGDTVLADALALAAKLVQEGTATVYSALYYQQQLGKHPGVQLPAVPEQEAAVRQVLCEDVKGVLIGFLLGTMIGPALAQSPQLAAILAPQQSSVTAQDCGIARAVELSAAAVASHIAPWLP